MSFYSYKNANADLCPGTVTGNVCNGLSEKICIQVKNVYDACLQQEQLDDVEVTVSNIVPVLPDANCRGGSNRTCTCSCSGNSCNCSCPNCGGTITHEQAVENAENSTCPLPAPIGQWTFESCRSANTKGTIRNLTIDRMCDRPQFARIKGIVDIPIDVLFTDDRCQEWMGTATVSVQKDVLLAIPEESIVPFTLESLVSAICVSGDYIGNCKFEIIICVTIVLKILAEVELMIPSYGFCQIPPCEEFAENVCDEFFSLPLFPQKAGPTSVSCANGNCSTPCVNNCGVMATAYTGTSSCSNCGTTCGSSNSSLCPRCGCTMTQS
ncbi:hypothetical protein LJC33_09300 [Eubacteriales bacterium OttesenSCG-928-N13]|nr:hypothetical protein [Eubacteriales bacterium OttesenSCG-928-N13]